MIPIVGTDVGREEFKSRRNLFTKSYEKMNGKNVNDITMQCRESIPHSCFSWEMWNSIVRSTYWIFEQLKINSFPFMVFFNYTLTWIGSTINLRTEHMNKNVITQPNIGTNSYWHKFWSQPIEGKGFRF